MKYWILTFQGTGIALVAGSLITNPPLLLGSVGGMWLIIMGFLLYLLEGE